MPQPLCDGVGVSLISLTVPHDFDIKQFFGIFWSLVPYAFLGVFIFGMAFTQRLSFTLMVLFGLVIAAINEFIIKKVHQEDRPEHSCLDSNGFPSGHATIGTLFLIWLTLEFIIHPGWTVRKRVVSIVSIWVLLGPAAPFRHVSGDHSWNQIAGGVVVGAIWGTLLFLFTQFVVVRYLDYIMNWRIVKFIGIKNDWRPNYEHSKNKGAKAPTKVRPAKPQNPVHVKKSVYIAAHVFIIFINLALGIIGVALAAHKKRAYDNCDRSSPEIAIGVAVWTFICGLIQLAIFILTLRKLNNKSTNPEIVQGLLYLAAIFIFEAFFWNVAGVATSTEDDNCPGNGNGDPTLVYAVVWFAVQFMMLVFCISMYYFMGIRRIYGFKRRPTMSNSNPADTWPEHKKGGLVMKGDKGSDVVVEMPELAKQAPVPIA